MSVSDVSFLDSPCGLWYRESVVLQIQKAVLPSSDCVVRIPR